MDSKKLKALETGLFIFGCVGVVATAISAGRDTLKAEHVLYVHSHEERDKQTPYFDSENTFKENLIDVGDIVCATWKCYIPTTITLSLTITALVISKHMSARQIMLLSSTVASTGGLVTKYRDKIREISGEEILAKVDKAVAEDEIVKAKSPVISSPDFIGSHTELDLNSDEEVLFFDEFTGQKFYSSKLAFIGAKYYLNRNFQIGGGASLQMFYAFLGLTLPEEYNYVGWDADQVYEDGYCWIDIDCVKSDKPDPETGKLYYTIIYGFEPGDNEYSYSHYPGGCDPILYDGSVPLEA